MPPQIDLTGKIFGKLTAIKRVENNPRYGQAVWLFKCDCGNDYVTFGYNVNHNKVVSCGCYNKSRLLSGSQKTHGMSNIPEYRTWASMRDRCTRKSNKAYKDYGGRKIKICDRWLESFENFFEDMGKKPTSKHSLDRINNDGNYEPSNCRWATQKQQNRNTRVSIMVNYNGTRKSLNDFAEELNLPIKTIYARYHRGLRNNELFEPIKNPGYNYTKNLNLRHSKKQS